MKENEIKFKLKNHEGKETEIIGELHENDDKVYRMGKPILCNCTGNTQETATPFTYNKEKTIVECKECGRQSSKVYTFKDYEESELNNIHLKFFGTDYITLQDLYKLSYTLPYEEWIKVSDLFMKLKPEMVDMGFFEPQFVGWVTSNPEEVEKRLGVREELRVGYQKQKQEEERLKKEKEMLNLQENINRILEEFSIVETPIATGKDGKFHLDGIVVDNPLNPRNQYGGGEWFIIDKENENIWYVRNNSRDGDNWDFNNIYVKGTAGAIGKKISFDEDLSNRILSLRR